LCMCLCVCVCVCVCVCGIGVLTQGLHLESLHQFFVVGYFQDRVSKLFAQAGFRS
jgi:hypothetical protein